MNEIQGFSPSIPDKSKINQSWDRISENSMIIL
jgi:hypothetical protein